MTLVPTPVDLDGPFAYARAEPMPRRAADREVVSPPHGLARGSAGRMSPAGDGREPVTALGKRLVMLGLLDAATLGPLAAGLERSSSGAAELLERAGRVLGIETEVVEGAIRADKVAARLAALAPDLRRASFEQIAVDLEEPHDAEDLTASSERPVMTDVHVEGERRISSLPDEANVAPDAPVVGMCRVRAHVELCSWEILAIDRGPWLDLSAILGLLNSVLRHLRSDTRFVVLRGDDARARVLAAPAAGLEVAVREGLLELESPDDALLRSFGDGDDAEERDAERPES